MKLPTIFSFAMTLVLFYSCKNDQNGGAEYQTSDKEITWLSLEEAESLNNTEKKGYFIDLYTSWCGWCKVMDKQTFTNEEIIKYMNGKYHNVKFDAEQRDLATFAGKDYEWMKGGRNGVNQLAVDLLNGDLSYPSYVVLDENKKPLKIFKGFMEAESFLQVLKTAQ